MTEPGKPTTPIVLRIKLRYEDVDTLVARFAPNVGKAGLFLPTKSIHPVGTELKFEIRLSGPDAPPVIVGLGRVKSARDPDPANPRAVFGIGVELMRVTKESREVILKMLERRRSVGLADVSVPAAEDVEAARRAGGDDATGIRPILDAASGPVQNAEVTPTPAPAPLPIPAPVVDRPSDALLTAPRRQSGPMAVQRVVAAAAVAPLAPEPSRRARRTLGDLIASVSATASAPSGDMFGGDDEVDVQSVLARARTLAAGTDLDAELEALKDAAAAPLAEITIEAASAELARQLGGVAVDRKNRGAKGTGWAVPPPSAPAPAATEVDAPREDEARSPVAKSTAALVLAKLAGRDDAADFAVAPEAAASDSATGSAAGAAPLDPPVGDARESSGAEPSSVGSVPPEALASDAMSDPVGSVPGSAGRPSSDAEQAPAELALRGDLREEPDAFAADADESRPTLSDPELTTDPAAPSADGTYDDPAFARAQSEAPETLPETEEVGDDDVVEEIGDADVDELRDDPPEATVAVMPDPRIYAASIPTEDPDDVLLLPPTHSQHTVAVDPERALLIDDDVDPAVFDDRALDPDPDHAELDLDAAQFAGQTSVGPAPTAIATAKDYGYERDTIDPDLQQHQLADRLDRALADADDEDFSFDEGTRNAAAEQEAEVEAEIDDFEILDEANLEEGADFVNRLELSNEFSAAPDDPLAGFRDSVVSYGDERDAYRAPSDPLAGFSDDPSDPEGQPTWDPGTGSYTYAQQPRSHRAHPEVADRFDSEFEARSTGYAGAHAFEDTALPTNPTGRPRGYTVPPEPTTADPDLEHALEALDVDLDDLSGNRPAVARVNLREVGDAPTNRPVTGSVRRAPRAPRAKSEDDGIMIDFDDDE